MKRREFITVLGGMAVAWPVVTRAQQPVKKIGFLSISSPGLHAPFVAAFNEGLKEAGFVEGQNLAIEYSWAEGRFDRLPALAADLVHDKVDVIAAMSGDVSIRAAIRASSTIPVVFITGSDPVQTGLVASLGRPGGNVTGFSMIATELMAKRFELLSELVPQIRTIALLVNPKYHSATEGTIPLVQQAASAKGVRLHILNATDDDEFEPAFASLARLKADALIVGTDPFLQAVVSGSWPWHRVTPFRQSTNGKNLLRREVLSVTGRASRPCIVRLASTSVRFSKEQNQLICRSNNRLISSLSSISRPPRHLASLCHRPCSQPPTR